MLKFVFTLLLFAFTSIAAEAQHTITKRDYDRAVSFRWNNVKSLAHNLEVTPHWFSDSTGFWYISTDEKGKEYQQYTFNGYIKAPLFDHLRFADSLSEILNEKIDPWKLPNRNTEVVDNTSIQFEARDKTWRLNTADYSISEFTPKAPTTSVEIKGKWRAFTQDYNIWVEDTTTGQKHQLSTDGRKDFEYASYYGWFDKMHGESSERPLHFYVNWSENGQFLKVDICDTRNADKMYMLDYGVDSLYRPNLLSYYRGSPGDTNMVKMQTIFFNMNTLQKVDIDLPVTTHITTPRYIWSDEPGIIYAINDHRGYLQKDIVKIDLNKARIETLFREESKIGIDDFKLFIHEDKKVIHFLSERSGWRQLHEYNLRNGKIKNISNGQYYIQDILKWDFENDLVYFTASGREQLTIPYYHKLYSTSLKNGHTELLTPENGHHDVHISLNGEFIVDNISMVMQPTYTTLRDLKTGAMLSDVSRAEISKLRETGWKAPLTFQCIGRDGETPIYAAIWRPSNFNPNKKYPVIDHSYTGPHTQAFPKSFKESLYTPNQAIAELGFIVVRIDGMGTAQRSLAFRSASYKNMGANLEDHVIAIKAMAKQFSWIDSDRVGVFGHSAGGYDAGHAVLAYPDFYKVAVASSADHDFRMEKAWWPEMYMGWPVDSTYEAVSNITMAGSLKGKLLLVHGALDDNVNVSATYKLAEALIKYDKEFDLLILPSQKHGFKDEHLAYFRKKRWNYFVEHLLGAEPIWGFDVDGKAEPTDEVILQGLISDYENKPESLKETTWSNLDSTFIKRKIFWLNNLNDRLNNVDLEKLTDQNRINKDLLSLVIGDQLFNLEFNSHQFPLDSEGGFIAGTVYTALAAPKNTDKEHKQYIDLIKALPNYFNQRIRTMREGQKAGKSSPKLIVNKSLELIDLFLATQIEECFYMQGVEESRKPEIYNLINNTVHPAYKKMQTFLKEEYLEAAPEQPGIAEISEGRSYYEQRVRYFTTIDISPEEVFETGMAEVKRIRAEMDAIIAQLGFEGDYADFLKFLREDEQFYAKSGGELLQYAAWITKRMEGQLPKYFGKLPRMPLTVTPVPGSLAPNYTAGRYSPGSYSQNRAGEYWVNTTKLKSRPLYVLPALTLHEGVPGHHTQIMLAAEIEGLPDFRKNTYLSSYGEGWALYAEFLGKEAGIYTTAYEDFGRLTYEMWRACRLVVDPGMHYMGWSREKAFDFMATNTALSLHEVGTEIDRYIGWPGQAVSYKMGELKIKELRAYSEEKLGDNFDIREFHDVILMNGSIPMETLQWVIEVYIENKLKKP